MGGHATRTYGEDAGLLRLMGGLLIPPAAWFLDLQTSYALVKWVCRTDVRVVLLAIPAVSLTLIAYGAWLAWSSWRAVRATADPSGGRQEDRSYLLALAGMGLSGLFALLVVDSLPFRLLLSPCQ